MKEAQKKVDPKLIKALLENAEKEELFGKEGFFQQLKQALVNEMLQGEMNHHLGYVKHDKSPKGTENRRNGTYPKQVISDSETLLWDIPRDRDTTFEPQIIPKNARRFNGFDEKVLSLYARGMSVREMQEHLYEIYGTEVSHDLISQVTDTVMEEVKLWQNRPLEKVYPVLFLDCIFVKLRDNHMIINKAVHLALAINAEGQQELLGMWIAKTEGAKFWMQVMTELKNRGVEDVFIACVDGLSGFEEAINTIFPHTTVQTCIVHLIRNSLKFVPWKDRKEVANDLKKIYNGVNEEAASEALNYFKRKWDKVYPTVSDIWEAKWSLIIPCFAFPEEIRKVVYTTNAVESVNRQIRKIIKNKGVFSTDDSVKKILFLALRNAAKKWTMPIQNWPNALNQLALLFPDRIFLLTQNL